LNENGEHQELAAFNEKGTPLPSQVSGWRRLWTWRNDDKNGTASILNYSNYIVIVN